MDFSKLVKFKNPFAGELDLRFQIVNHNEVTGRCQIRLASELPGLNPIISPIETVSIYDLENVD